MVMGQVLVVDDSRTMRRIVSRSLRQAGFGDHPVVEAENARQALAAVAAYSPVLVLSDWNMPGMSGLALLRALRANGEQVPVGLVTSEGSTPMRELAAAAGAAFLLAKPFTPQTLRLAVAPWLGGAS